MVRTKQRLIVVAWGIVVILGLALVAQRSGWSLTPQGNSDPTPASVQEKTYRRIVSLSPSITECLFALGLGERVVGVTDFCDYPPEALTKDKVGGYYDLNYEAIVALHPDLVVCLPEHREHLANLDRLDLPHVTVNHRHVRTILTSLTTLGRVCGVPEQAQAVVEDICRRMEAVKERLTDGNHPRVLVCVGRSLGSAIIDDVSIAGRGGFYDEMVTLAGGVNAYEDRLAYPILTGEGLLRLQPEIIIDMVTDLSESGLSEADVRRQWDSLEDLPAVKEGRVFLFAEDFVVVPGPRFIETLEKMAVAIHPEGIER